MSDLDNRKKRRPLKSLPPDRFQPKVLIFFLALFLAALALLFLSPARLTSPAVLKMQAVVELAEQGKIKEGVIRTDASGGRDWVVVTGETKPEFKLQSDRGETNQFRAAGRLTDSNMERLQKSQAFTEQPATTLFTQIAAQVVPFLIIIGLLYFLFVRQLRQAGKGALSFGKSRAKLLTRDRDKVTFADVAGCDEAKEEVSEVVEFLKDPKKFTKMGGKIPKGS